MTLPIPPNRNMAADIFIEAANAFMAALPQFQTEMNTMYAGMTSISGGGALCIPYTYGLTASAGTASGNIITLFPNGGAQGSATRVDLDTVNAIGNMGALLDTYDDSGSGIKGHLRIVKINDPTKWWIGKVTAISTSGTYTRGFSVTGIIASSTNPFTAGDKLLTYFERTGDVGQTGTIVRRPVSTADTATLTVDMNNYDLAVISALTQNTTIATPTGTMTAGRQLMLQIKDNGTARLIAYSTAFRASTDLPLPNTTTASKWLYLGFIYNATDSKWDLVSVLNNI